MSSLPIGVLTTSYPTHRGSGAGTFVRGFCAACGAAGLPVEVLCPEPAKAVDPPRDRGVDVVPLSYFRPRQLQFLSDSPGAPEALAQTPALWAPAAAYTARLTAEVLARRSRYRALVSHWLVPSAFSGVLAADLPHLAIAHGSDVHLLGRLPLGRALARWMVRQGLCFAFVSGALQRRFAALLSMELQETLQRQSVVQPMGVDTASVAGGDREGARARLGLRGPVALWLGRFTALKRPAMALALAQAAPELTLIMAGTGPAEPCLRRQARPLGRRVRFTGWVEQAQRRELLAAADVLVITSTVLADGRSEGLPVVASEALAAGLPVAATRVGGLAELCGLYGLAGRLDLVRLVDDGHVAGLAQACRSLWTVGRPDEVTRARLAQRLDWQAVLPRLLAPIGL